MSRLDEINQEIARRERLSQINAMIAQKQGQAEQLPTQQPIQEPSFMDKAIGGAEGAATMISGMAAMPIAGIAGLADTALTGLGLAPEGAGASRVKQVQKMFTYEPRSERGQQEIQSIAQAIQPIAKPLEDWKRGLGDDAFNAYGGEIPIDDDRRKALATMMYTLPDAALEFFTAGLGGRVSQLSKQAQRLSKAQQPKIARTENEQPPQVFREEGAPQVFKTEGVTPTRGDVTQDFAQQKVEAQLFEEASDVGEGMRSARLGQSREIKESLNKLVNKLGVSQELGESVKSALSSRKGVLKDTRKKMYNQLSKEASSVDLPISTTELKRALPEGGIRRDLAAGVPGASKALDGLLREFNIIGKEGPDVLSIGNFERFRKRLVSIEKMDQSRQITLATGPLKKAIDNEVSLVTDSLIKNGNANISGMAKDARKSHIALMTEFDPKAMTSKLIDSKRGSNEAQIENSQIYQKLSSKSTPIETYSSVVKSLKKRVPEGRKALADLKNRTILDLIDTAYGAGSRKIAGERTFGAAAYQKAVETNRPKLEKLFTSREMKTINNIYKIAEKTRPPSGAVMKGSAGFLIDVMHKMGVATLVSKIPGVGALAVDQITELSKRARSRKALEHALTLPKYKATVDTIRSQYPNLALVLGIGKLESQKEKDNR